MRTAIDLPAEAGEHVLLTAEPTDELEDVEPTSVDAEIDQLRRGRGQHATIFNGTYLSVRAQAGRGRETSYWLNLAFVDPAPVRRAGRLRVTVALACAAPVAGMVLALLAPGIPSDLVWRLGPPAAIAALIAGLVLAIRDYRSVLVYCTRHGRVPVLRLGRALPDRRRARRFLDRLAAASERARRDAPAASYLRDEMREHRRLLDQGVLDATQFEAARAAILRAHG